MNPTVITNITKKLKNRIKMPVAYGFKLIAKGCIHIIAKLIENEFEFKFA